MSLVRREELENILLEWPNLREEIRHAFEKRDKKAAAPLMEKGISLFIKFLYWSNGLTNLGAEINYEELHIKPVNCEERLQFIMTRPNLHHSYMQLCELMNEQEKGYRKALAIKGVK